MRGGKAFQASRTACAKSGKRERTELVPRWPGLCMARRKSVGVDGRERRPSRDSLLHLLACLSQPLAVDQQSW